MHFPVAPNHVIIWHYKLNIRYDYDDEMKILLILMTHHLAIRMTSLQK